MWWALKRVNTCALINKVTNITDEINASHMTESESEFVSLAYIRDHVDVT